ncbi:hypothetical protein pdam_00003510, partial [Pocillopora damicornis]
MVAESIAGPLTTVIDNCIRKYYFPKAWKNARISPNPKVDQPKYEATFVPFQFSPLSKLQRCAQELNSSRNTVSSWSNNPHLALNLKKTKTMLLSTRQMSRVCIHSLDRNRPTITISDSTLEYVNVSKLLGVHIHQHLIWDEHVPATCKSCYGTIQIIRKLKNFAGYRLRKHLMESLVLYVNDINDIVTVGWLPTTQRRDFHVLKLGYQALHSTSWLSYVPLDRFKHLRSLRSGAATRLIIPMERGTFQDSTAKLFNALPVNIRNCGDFKVYWRRVNTYLSNSICK